jgi:transposase
MEKNVVMGPRFRRVERDQQFLLPPDVREWLPVGHPALFVVEVVSELDLSGFVDGYRSSRDRGRPAYHPEVMVGILLYASMTATMSSRRIEKLLATDVGFRVVAANERPDHGTI